MSGEEWYDDYIGPGACCRWHPSYWTYIECDDSKQITILVFDKADLTGPIPDGFGGLRNLEVLSLSYNQLTGTVPDWIRGLKNLQFLSLSHNQLNGTVPDGIGSLKNLQELYLSYNQLTGHVPDEIGELKNLQFLYLDGNQLTGPVPSSISQLPLNYNNRYKSCVINPQVNGGELSGAPGWNCSSLCTVQGGVNCQGIEKLFSPLS
jgi:hypothetical protein